MKTEKFMNYITAQIIYQLENRLDPETIVDVKNEDEVREVLGEKFWDALTRPEQKIVLVDLYEKHMKDDVNEVAKFFNIIKFYDGRKWYSKDFYTLMDELMDKHMLNAEDTIKYGVNCSLQDILGFELLITLNKEERKLAKNFLDDYAYVDWGPNQFIRVDDGIYRFEKYSD
jgi:hypothetical protein